MTIQTLFAVVLTGIFFSAAAQKSSPDDKNQQIIIIKNGEKNSKITIETKDGKVYVNGKPGSEYKDANISVITQNINGNHFIYKPGRNMNVFADGNGDKKAFLGVTTSPANNGIIIVSVQKGSAAEKAGLKEGDIITKVGNRKIDDPEELMEVITSYKPKQEVKINYERNGRPDDVKVILGESSSVNFSFNSDKRINTEAFNDFNKNFQYHMSPMPLAPLQDFPKIWGFGYKKLGVRVEDLENGSGARITNVEENSVAEKSGLKKDDIITEVDGKKVDNVEEVLEQVRDTEKDAYHIKAKRNGTEMNFDISYPKKLNNADL